MNKCYRCEEDVSELIAGLCGECFDETHDPRDVDEDHSDADPGL